MFDAYNATKNEFNKNFINLFNSNHTFSKALNYSIAEGKRVRPVILLETFKMLSNNVYDSRVLNFATALELIHNYSLVHDDLPAMDDDDYRRGRLTLHKKFREDIAILVGDGLLNSSFEIMIEQIINSTDLKSMRESSQAAKIITSMAGIEGMILGQVSDVLENSKSSEDIINMYEKKTCGLIIAATVAAAYLASSDEKAIKDMYNLGRYIGLCFQLQDDLLDHNSDEKIGKVTYITYKGLSETKREIDELTDKAINILKNYNNNEFLTKLVKKLVKREY